MSNDDDMMAAAGDDVMLQERFQFEDWCEQVASDLEDDQ